MTSKKHWCILNKCGVSDPFVMSAVNVVKAASSSTYYCSKFRDVFFLLVVRRRGVYLISIDTSGSHIGTGNSLALFKKKGLF